MCSGNLRAEGWGQKAGLSGPGLAGGSGTRLRHFRLRRYRKRKRRPGQLRLVSEGNSVTSPLAAVFPHRLSGVSLPWLNVLKAPVLEVRACAALVMTFRFSEVPIGSQTVVDGLARVRPPPLVPSRPRVARVTLVGERSLPVLRAHGAPRPCRDTVSSTVRLRGNTPYLTFFSGLFSYTSREMVFLFIWKRAKECLRRRLVVVFPLPL